jgi:hypothetical protein
MQIILGGEPVYLTAAGLTLRRAIIWSGCWVGTLYKLRRGQTSDRTPHSSDDSLGRQSPDFILRRPWQFGNYNYYAARDRRGRPLEPEPCFLIIQLHRTRRKEGDYNTTEPIRSLFSCIRD